MILRLSPRLYGCGPLKGPDRSRKSKAITTSLASGREPRGRAAAKRSAARAAGQPWTIYRA